MSLCCCWECCVKHFFFKGKEGINLGLEETHVVEGRKYKCVNYSYFLIKEIICKNILSNCGIISRGDFHLNPFQKEKLH